MCMSYEPRHDKTNKVSVRPVKTQISLGIRPVWPESSLSAWRKLGSLATHWAHSEDSDQTGRMPRLIWVFAGCTLILLVLTCRGSFMSIVWHYMDRVKRIWYLSPMRAAKVQASLRIRAVSPEPSLLAHTRSESREAFRQKARSLAPLNGWVCAVKVCHDGMFEDTNSLDGAHMKTSLIWSNSIGYAKSVNTRLISWPYDFQEPTN